MEKMAEKETVLCVISKSGNTLEIKAGLDILRPVMKKKYGDRVSERIITITGSKVFSGRKRNGRATPRFPYLKISEEDIQLLRPRGFFNGCFGNRCEKPS